VIDDRNFYGIFSISSISKMTETSLNTKENLPKQRKKNQDKVHDAKRQEKAQKVKKRSIPS
jgi:hypothetical protein